MKLRFLILFSILLFSLSSFANIERQRRTLDDIGVTVGTFLPWGFPGVRDQYRFWGFNYFHPSSIWDLEYEFLNGRGGEVTYYTASVGPRFDYRLSNALDVFLNIGLAYHYYKRKPSTTQSFPFRSSVGIFLGAGTLIDITERLKFRAEFKFHNAPGKSVYIGMGPSFVF